MIVSRLRKHFMITIVSLSVAFGTLQCTRETPSCFFPEANQDAARFVVLPGRQYRVVFPHAPSASAPDSLGNAANWARLILAPMYRKAVVLKADDFKATEDEKWQKFLCIVLRLNLRSSVGLICNSLLMAHQDILEWMKSFDGSQIEIFVHGWDHSLGEDHAEFKGSALETQFRHLQLAIHTMREKLGITPHTFGAPGNAIDQNTLEALIQNPEIKVWLFGLPNEEIFVLPRILEIEKQVGSVYSKKAFISFYEKKKQAEVLTLQLHPRMWTTEDFQNFLDIVGFLATTADRQFMTPYGYYTWLQDRDKILVVKIGENAYLIDCRNARYSHELDFFAPPDSFSEVAPQS